MEIVSPIAFSDPTGGECGFILLHATPTAPCGFLEDLAPKRGFPPNMANLVDPLGQRFLSTTEFEAMVVLTTPQLPKDFPSPTELGFVHFVNLLDSCVSASNGNPSAHGGNVSMAL